MSSVIKKGKSNAKSSVKPISVIQTLGSDTGRYEMAKSAYETELERELLLLKTENKQLKTALVTQAKQAKEALEALKKETTETVSASIQKDFSDAYDLLVKNVEGATKAFETKLVELDGLALLVAQTALEKVFIPNDDYKELVTRFIQQQMTSLRQEAILGVQVSAHDFENDEALEDLSFAMGLDRASMTISPQLKAGDCVIDLRLGHVEMSVQDQWGELKTLFAEMAKEGVVS